MAKGQMSDETRLGLAEERLAQAADLMAQAAKLVGEGAYPNCQPGTYRFNVLMAVGATAKNGAKVVKQAAESCKYVAERLDNAPSNG
jgi:hypothetical protein